MAADTHTVTIGKTTYRGSDFALTLKPRDRLRHLYLIGKTGTGKSTLFQNMMLQDIESGAGGCFVDPHGEAIDWLLERIPPQRLEDVILFDPSDSAWPMGLNLLEWHTEEEKDFLVSEAIEIFYKLFDPQRTGIIGPQFEHWMRNAALTIMADPAGGTLVEIPRLFTDTAFEQTKRRHVTDKVVQSFWDDQMSKTAHFHRSEMLNYFTSKFGRFMTNALIRNIIGQTKSAFSLQDIIQQRKILLINLSKGKIGELNAHMLGLILMTKLHIATLKQATLPAQQRVPFYLYVDEFQNVITEAFISMLSESRKYGLAVHLTHQYITQLTDSLRDAVLGNVGTLLAFQVSSQDAAVLLPEFEAKTARRRLDPLTAEDMQYLAPHHFYVRLVIDGVTYPPLLGHSLPPRDSDTVLRPHHIQIINRARFCQPRVLVEQQLRQRFNF